MAEESRLIAGSIQIGVRNHTGVKFRNIEGNLSAEDSPDLFQDPVLLDRQRPDDGGQVPALRSDALFILDCKKMYGKIVGNNIRFLHLFQKKKKIIGGNSRIEARTAESAVGDMALEDFLNGKKITDISFRTEAGWFVVFEDPLIIPYRIKAGTDVGQKTVQKGQVAAAEAPGMGFGIFPGEHLHGVNRVPAQLYKGDHFLLIHKLKDIGNVPEVVSSA